MNSQMRQALIRNADGVVADTIKTWHSWSDRWGAYCALMRAFHGDGHGDAPTDEEMEKFSGEFLRRLIDETGAPRIDDLYQALIYFGSSWAPHRIAAHSWNQRHPDELREFQRQHPDVPLLTEIKVGGPTGRYIDAGGETHLLLTLRQTLYIVAADEDPPPTGIAIRRWMRGLASKFRNGALRAVAGAEVTAPPHDHKGRMVEVAALYLEGRLIPADTETEISLNDDLEHLHSAHAEAVETLFAAAGRPMTGWSRS